MIESEANARSFTAKRCEPAAMAKLEQLAAALREESTRQNLIAAATFDHIWQRHISDSAQLLDHVPRETSPWLDIGAGAGFPGLVIAVCDPSREICLVESRRKRIDWLEQMIMELNLTNCRVEGRRLELVETFAAGVISARAFAPLPRLLALSARFSTERTHWVLPKGRSAAKEVEDLSRKLRKLFHVEQSHTDPDAGIIVGQGRVEARA